MTETNYEEVFYPEIGCWFRTNRAELMNKTKGPTVLENLRGFHDSVGQDYARYANPSIRKQLLEQARKHLHAAHGDTVPFAFATQKGEFVFSVRPHLTGAVNAARSRLHSRAGWLASRRGSPTELPMTSRGRFCVDSTNRCSHRNGSARKKPETSQPTYSELTQN